MPARHTIAVNTQIIDNVKRSFFMIDIYFICSLNRLSR